MCLLVHPCWSRVNWHIAIDQPVLVSLKNLESFLYGPMKSERLDASNVRLMLDITGVFQYDTFCYKELPGIALAPMITS